MEEELKVRNPRNKIERRCKNLSDLKKHPVRFIILKSIIAIFFSLLFINAILEIPIKYWWIAFLGIIICLSVCIMILYCDVFLEPHFILALLKNNVNNNYNLHTFVQLEMESKELDNISVINYENKYYLCLQDTEDQKSLYPKEGVEKMADLAQVLKLN